MGGSGRAALCQQSAAGRSAAAGRRVLGQLPCLQRGACWAMRLSSRSLNILEAHKAHHMRSPTPGPHGPARTSKRGGEVEWEQLKWPARHCAFQTLHSRSMVLGRLPLRSKAGSAKGEGRLRLRAGLLLVAAWTMLVVVAQVRTAGGIFEHLALKVHRGASRWWRSCHRLTFIPPPCPSCAAHRPATPGMAQVF